jgi:DNA-binding protein HU-beta
MNRTLYVLSHGQSLPSRLRRRESLLPGPSLFLKYFLAFKLKLCIMPLFMQFCRGSPCPTARGADLEVRGGASNCISDRHKEEESMTKADLIAKMAGSAGITKAAAEKALAGFLSGVSAALAKGDKVTLVGFGTFSVAKRAAREGRNPQTGKKIKIKASKVVKFKAGSKMKSMVQ